MNRIQSRLSFRPATPVFHGFLLASLLFAGSVSFAEDLSAPSMEEAVAGMERMEGFLTLYADAAQGKLLLELPAPDRESAVLAEMILVDGVSHGMGSNPIGIDRGEVGASRLVRFRRVGGKIVLEQPNLSFRALSNSADERNAVRHSFARSVLWASKPVAQAADGSVLLDLADFVLQDHSGIAETLSRSGQGDHRMDPSKSAIEFAELHVFPDNVEIDLLSTFVGKQAGNFTRSVTPTPTHLTLTQHLSFVRLPDAGYKPRKFDPRMASFAIEFLDYAVPLSDPIRRDWIVRHRLEKKNPSRARSKAKKPIIYYVDRGAPEPIRSALIEGASWWSEAFQAAGFEDGYRVELLPEGVHPLDVRYNVIQWVHRSTRGWSYGGGVVDPRTGERIKGNVNLGSLRVRQDRLLFEGLLGTGATGSGRPDDPIELALARIRQLAAHEVGHCLGFTHNFAASTYGRASVMDYPAPWIHLDAEGKPDTSRTYAVGMGEWDIHAARWAYTPFADEQTEARGLEAIVQDGLKRGLRFISDADARPDGAAHPLANLWDNGEDPVAELDAVRELRRVALENFDEQRIAEGQPLALLQEVLAPIYFYHRYQLQAAARSIGGVDYSYSVRGDGQATQTRVRSFQQRAAVAALMRFLEPEALDLSDRVLDLLAPRPFGYGDNRELFNGQSEPLFDPMAAARTASAMVIDELLQPQRAARLIEQHRRDPEQLSFDEVLENLERRFLARIEFPAGRLQTIQELQRELWVERLMELAAGEFPYAVRVAAEASLERAHSLLKNAPLGAKIARFKNRPWAEDATSGVTSAPPPGSPIGGGYDLGFEPCAFVETSARR